MPAHYYIRLIFFYKSASENPTVGNKLRFVKSFRCYELFVNIISMDIANVRVMKNKNIFINK